MTTHKNKRYFIHVLLIFWIMHFIVLFFKVDVCKHNIMSLKKIISIFFSTWSAYSTKLELKNKLLYSLSLMKTRMVFGLKRQPWISFQYPEPSLNQYKLRKYLKVNKKVIDWYSSTSYRASYFLFCLRKWEEEWERPFKRDL